MIGPCILNLVDQFELGRYIMGDITELFQLTVRLVCPKICFWHVVILQLVIGTSAQHSWTVWDHLLKFFTFHTIRLLRTLRSL